MADETVAQETPVVQEPPVTLDSLSEATEAQLQQFAPAEQTAETEPSVPSEGQGEAETVEQGEQTQAETPTPEPEPQPDMYRLPSGEMVPENVYNELIDARINQNAEERLEEALADDPEAYLKYFGVYPEGHEPPLTDGEGNEIEPNSLEGRLAQAEQELASVHEWMNDVSQSAESARAQQQQAALDSSIDEAISSVPLFKASPALATTLRGAVVDYYAAGKAPTLQAAAQALAVELTKIGNGQTAPTGPPPNNFPPGSVLPSANQPKSTESGYKGGGKHTLDDMIDSDADVWVPNH